MRIWTFSFLSRELIGYMVSLFMARFGPSLYLSCHLLPPLFKVPWTWPLSLLWLQRKLKYLSLEASSHLVLSYCYLEESLFIYIFNCVCGPQSRREALPQNRGGGACLEPYVLLPTSLFHSYRRLLEDAAHIQSKPWLPHHGSPMHQSVHPGSSAHEHLPSLIDPNPIWSAIKTNPPTSCLNIRIFFCVHFHADLIFWLEYPG